MQLALVTVFLVFLFGLMTAFVAKPIVTVWAVAVGAGMLIFIAVVAAGLSRRASRLAIVLSAAAVLTAGWIFVTLCLWPTITLRILAAGAITLFVLGVVGRLLGWFRTPQPFGVPLTPCPSTRWGAFGRVMADFLLFRSLWRSQEPRGSVRWFAHLLFAACSWLFHVSFWIVIIRHLRYFIYPVPFWVEWFRDIGIWAGYVLAIAAFILLLRRLAVAREAFISVFADYFAIGLLILIAASGLLIHYYARADIAKVKDFLLHAMNFQLEPKVPPLGVVMLVHIVAVLALVAYFPYSKLMHGLGLLFNPTRNQPNDVRFRRHVNPWNDEIPL